jgi:hypothetical protein
MTGPTLPDLLVIAQCLEIAERTTPSEHIKQARADLFRVWASIKENAA